MDEKISIEPALRSDAAAIAPLIMEAMNYDCCQNWAGPDHSLDDFRLLMTQLIESDKSQYSYKNATVARCADGTVVAVCICYDGGSLHELRKTFVESARRAFGIDYSNIDDETTAGEFYIDSLAVRADFRSRGIATELLHHAIDECKRRCLPQVGLLVDANNPAAQRLYESVGFEFQNHTSWGGHAMNHLAIQFIY